MKISNSKKQLARIISENGGWREGALWAAQDQEHRGKQKVISFYINEKPWFTGGTFWRGNGVHEARIATEELVRGWHQTILSRDEYFHLYPASDADGWIEWKGGECPVKRGAVVDVKYANGVTNYGVSALTDKASANHVCGTATGMLATNWGAGLPMSGIIAYRLHKPEQQKPTAVGDDETNLAAKEELEALEFEPAKPTIEQLAADYRAKLAIAQRAQEEADSHRCGAEAALEKLAAAGKAVGLVLGVAAPELVITDWRDLQLGDIIEYVNGDIEDKIGMTGPVVEFAENASDGMFVQLRCDTGSNKGRLGWPREWRFICRPAKGDANA